MLPRQTPEPAGRQEADVLPGLRLIRPRSAVAATVAAGLAGFLLALANPPADLGPLAFVALIPLFWASEGARAPRSALLGVTTGLVYYGILLVWLRPLGLLAWLPLVVSQALWLALFGAVRAVLRRPGQPVLAAVTAAASWTAIDWARATWPVGGFAWGGLGYTQHANGLLLPLASVTGVWGVTFVVVLVNGLLWSALKRRRQWGRGRLLVLVAGATAIVVAPAAIPLPTATGPKLDVAVVQGNVPRAMAGDPLLRGDTVQTNEISLGDRLAGRPPNLVVWPENALDVDPRFDPATRVAVSRAIARVGAPTLVGAVEAASRGRLYNDVFLYSGRGEVIGRYRKIHLVPFGEYIPFRRFFAWSNQYRRGNAEFVAGHRITLFDIRGQLVGAPICFENVFPDLFRRFVAAGANVVVTTTNDSSFLRSPASREHVVFSQLRAVETGRWVVQAAISGESAIVNPRGQILRRTGVFKRSLLRMEVPTSTAVTMYTRLGDWFPWACGIAVCLAMAVSLLRRVTRRRAAPPPAGERRHPPSQPAQAPAPISGAAERRTLVVLPTYNERETVARAAAGVLAVSPNVHALVIDDASPDGTGDLVAALAEQEPRVRLLRRPGKLGLASAYMTGFAAALKDGYDVVVEMDADLSHQPEDLPALLEGSTRYDLTIGSRYVPGGRVSNWSRSRLALSKAGNAYAHILLGLPVHDATSGYRAFRASLLEKLVARGINSDGYAFQVELAYQAWRLGAIVGEVPITFREREHGHSKLSRRIVIEALVKVAAWGVRDRLRGSSG